MYNIARTEHVQYQQNTSSEKSSLTSFKPCCELSTPTNSGIVIWSTKASYGLISLQRNLIKAIKPLTKLLTKFTGTRQNIECRDHAKRPHISSGQISRNILYIESRHIRFDSLSLHEEFAEYIYCNNTGPRQLANQYTAKYWKIYTGP
jgi:hypothetical protein